MSPTKLRITLLVAAGLFIAFHAQGVQAKTVVVGTCISGPPSFMKIQDAVNFASSGDTIEVCPGSYPEQVSITKPLTLKGVPHGTQDAAVIVPPASGMQQNATSVLTGLAIAAQLLVQSATGVAISTLTVDGTGNGLSNCSPNLIGIVYQNASGSVNDLAVRHQKLSAGFQGCQSGLGIYVESGSGGTSTVTVSNNAVRDYQKNGITGDGAGTSLTVTGNAVVGQGPTTGAAENGIQIGFGAAGTITTNLIINDIFSPASAAATGILVFASTGVSVSTNTIGNTQFGIAFTSDPTFGSADFGTASQNKIFGTQNFDGIELCSNHNTAQRNTISSSAQSGIHLDSTCLPSNGTGNNNTVTNNTINEACAAILEGTGTVGNTVTPNTFFNVTNTLLAGNVCTPPVAIATAVDSAGHARPVPY